MTKTLDLAGLATQIGELTARLTAIEEVLLDRAAQMIESEAKRTIGEYQAATDRPALRKGDLGDSIEHTVRAPSAHVGSNDPEVEYQELGSRTTPPRWFLKSSAFRKGIEVRDLMGDHFLRFISGPNG